MGLSLQSCHYEQNSLIVNLIKKIITLTGDKLNNYKFLIEKYAKENNLPNPKDFKCISNKDISFDDFKKLTNREKFINSLPSNEDDKTNSELEEIHQYSIKNSSRDFEILIYKTQLYLL
jgi:hypothetical protein